MLPLREDQPSRARGGKADLEFEIQFFEGITRRDPGNIEALQILGDAYTKAGHWQKGLRVDRRLARLCPDNPLVFYNLACSLSLLKRLDDAFHSLHKAVQLGYRDAKWMERDPDLANLRQDKRFPQFAASLRNRDH